MIHTVRTQAENSCVKTGSLATWKKCFTQPGLNIITVPHTAFTLVDPKSVKRYRWLDWVLTLWGATAAKVSRKYVDEIDPWTILCLRTDWSGLTFCVSGRRVDSQIKNPRIITRCLVMHYHWAGDVTSLKKSDFFSLSFFQFFVSLNFISTLSDVNFFLNLTSVYVWVPWEP